MWQSHPDLYKNKLEEIINTLDDSDTKYLVEVVDLGYTDNIKEKIKIFPICPEEK